MSPYLQHSVLLSACLCQTCPTCLDFLRVDLASRGSAISCSPNAPNQLKARITRCWILNTVTIMLISAQSFLQLPKGIPKSTATNSEDPSPAVPPPSLL
ncbi:uncharacterized protein BDR25DRAFT_109965 [Lindgomyces ingoldianus]|uniref:Uncharacterized protein n=1 Tax=Lindgomyces ingoldianus TaxID=673940 RepID=A0ACB6R7R2_9PLEO|nr:uncharacterized protein BDR25DRAFT_109965 [Lindgomyces ingoldianus]KAF2474567.1 hypothetical protein BDR25DRAFT_109965 [Lindgomyces ingoldianus]